MARMQGVESHEAGWMTRLIYWLIKRAIYKLTGESRVFRQGLSLRVPLASRFASANPKHWQSAVPVAHSRTRK